MSYLLDLSLILMPLFIGFFIRLPQSWHVWINTLLNGLVYVILLLIGLSLARVEHLGQQISYITWVASGLFVCIMLANLAGMMLFDKLIAPSNNTINPQTTTQLNAHVLQEPVTHGQAISFTGSIKQLGCVVLGVLLGLVLPDHWLPPENMGNYALMLLILLVGMQLNASGIKLRTVLINKNGLLLSLVFTLSALLGGIMFVVTMQTFGEAVSLTKGLALASGFGWYSLSSIIMHEAYGAVWGSIALINDLGREFFALILIPWFMRRYPNTAVGMGGATSLDFTLPVIQQSGGMGIVPLAISFGFIVNIISPILMVVLSAIA